MGIAGINNFIKTKKITNHISRRIFLYSLCRQKIAVDAYNWYFKMCYGARNQIIKGASDKELLGDMDYKAVFTNLAEKFLYFNIKFLEWGVLPIWVWDGKADKAKEHAWKKRREEKEKREKELEEMKFTLEMQMEHHMFEEEDAPDFIEGDVESCKEFLQNHEEDIGIDPELMERYKKKLVSDLKVDFNEIDLLKDFACRIGLPSFVGVGEAESYCASLVEEGYCQSAWSEDTDLYALGCPFILNRLELIKDDDGGKEWSCNCISTEDFRRSLGFTKEMMRDFCILCGTDYNDNLKGIGPVEAFRLIKKHKSLEKIAESGVDLSSIDYEMIRKLLVPVPVVTPIEMLQFNFEVAKGCKSVLEEVGLARAWPRYSNAVNTLDMNTPMEF